MSSKGLKTSKRPRPQDDEDEDDRDGSQPQASSGGFAAAMSKVLSRDLTGKATPVLAKRKTAQAKQADKAAVAAKAEVSKKKAHKATRKAHLAVPDPLQADFERQLRKVATKGVVALFNAISKHQRAIEVATEDASKPSAKAAVVAAQNKSFLDMLKGSVATSKAPSAGAKLPGFLSDDFVHKSASAAPSKKPASKGSKRVKEQELEEEDAWLGGAADDEGY